MNTQQARKLCENCSKQYTDMSLFCPFCGHRTASGRFVGRAGLIAFAYTTLSIGSAFWWMSYQEAFNSLDQTEAALYGLRNALEWLIPVIAAFFLWVAFVKRSTALILIGLSIGGPIPLTHDAFFYGLVEQYTFMGLYDGLEIMDFLAQIFATAALFGVLVIEDGAILTTSRAELANYRKKLDSWDLSQGPRE